MGRCYSTSANGYENYGGRGIIVCDRWRDENGFENFLIDIGNRPTEKHSLDRIDVNCNYEIGNVRWTDRSTQSHNQRKRNTNKSGYRGVSIEGRSGKWIATIWKNYRMYHLGLFSDLEQAALAYDTAAIQLYGDDAQTNILGVSHAV